MTSTSPSSGSRPDVTAGADAATRGARPVRVQRISRGHLLMTFVGLAAAVLAFAALRSEPGAARVAVAEREIRAGERVHRSDFRIAALSSDDALLAPMVQAHDLPAIEGRIAGATIEAGEMVPRRWLRPRAARGGLRAISIPIEPSRAVGGRLAAGDRVDVLVADDRSVSIIVPDAEVLAVDDRQRGGIGDGTSPFTVTIAVDADQSQLVAAAVVGGGLSLARTTGSTPASATAGTPVPAAPTSAGTTDATDRVAGSR